MNRGSVAFLLTHVSTALASMRPRFMNRGSGEIQHGCVGPLGASMRPRFMNRGSDVRHLRTRNRVQGFNEAPIHESGKFCDLDPDED